jgi:ATP-binding cassette subfamily B (MDR/TAP) protein 1
MAARGSGDDEEERGKVGLHSLFRFADASDVLLMVAGAAGAVANGVSQPLMTLLFGDVMEAFGSASRHDVLHRVSEVRLIPMDYRIEV